MTAKGASNLEAAWWPAARKSQLAPLAAVREAAEAMDAGVPVPRAAARLVADAFWKYLDGTGADITKNLGLRPRRGGRYDTPLARERLRNRNALIVRIFSAQPGDASQKARHVAALIAEPKRAAEVTEADVAAAVLELAREHGAELPKSARSILRVVNEQERWK